ncbi:MAG TPA: anti-sigma factor [Chitinophagaceae bacterium]|nr:anti-sigma factor [Chitinophagaceae bacterium]
MNIKEYISSGVIESYVLGLASDQERTEFEALCRQYPELVAARNEFELELEKQLNPAAIAPVPGLKQKILENLRQQKEESDAKLISLDEHPTRRYGSPLRWVAAASVILLLGAAWYAYQFYTQNKELRHTNEELQARIRAIDSSMNKLVEENEMMKNPNVAVVNMVGTTPARASASVYWDSTSQDVFLVVKNMPQLPSDKQYQLWALINGQPKDLGLFDVKNDEKRLILKMNNTQKAEAFAITVEARGNTGPPSLDNLQSMGKTTL